MFLKSVFIKINFSKTALGLFLFISSLSLAQNKDNAEKNVIPAHAKWSGKTALTILNKYPKSVAD
ncbi:hypothetical protein [Flavobacterium sp. H4147]|uniref:hypothetical protein n=1 Tax=Flavobacterium sp. H4147 TaxID=3034149 RepID=UPI0023EBC1DE|nr:hypothetical protein [Flavobacterium sp. H4147]